MSRLVWGETGKREYETGVKNGVVYLQGDGGLYPKGAAWDGLIGISEAPSGAEATSLYANDSKYLELTSAEDFNATITAYMYPDEFAICDGTAEIVPGVKIGQQTRKTFGLSYRTILGNDTENDDYGYRLHLVYGGKAAPSQKDYKTVNESPEAVEFSWEVSTTPVAVPGFKPTAHLFIDSTDVDAKKLEALEAILYGSESESARLPLPEEVIEIIGKKETQGQG